MRPVEQPAACQRLHVTAGGDGGHPQLDGEVGDPDGAPFAYQVQQAVMTFSGTFAHGGRPFAM